MSASACIVALLLLCCLAGVCTISPGPEAHALTKSFYNGVELGPPYNPNANTTDSNYCDAQLVILGLHGSRTSIVTRLMTLLGMPNKHAQMRSNNTQLSPP